MKVPYHFHPMGKKHSAFYITLLISILLRSNLIFAQQQISNSGFEFWEEIRSGVNEPIKWNSIKNMDGGMTTKKLAPDVISRSETSHSGKYALKLVNKSTLGIVANGIITNGAIHGNKNKDKSYIYTDARSNEFSTPFISRPDSLVGWYIYTPQEKDSAMVVVLLHRDKVTLPDYGSKQNWVGGVKLILPATKKSEWTRFSAPVVYFKKEWIPQYMLIFLSAGNRKQAVAGSEALFDDMQLIYNKNK
jgi:hypothetical protein